MDYRYVPDSALDNVLRFYQSAFREKTFNEAESAPDVLMEVFGITPAVKAANRQYWGRQLGMCWQRLSAEACRTRCGARFADPRAPAHRDGGSARRRAVPVALRAVGRRREGQALYLRNIRCLDERDTEAVEEWLSTVTVPTAVIWGADDAWLPADLSHRIAARIGAPPPTVIPDAGHFCMLDQPQAVTDALRAFLRETRAAAA